MTNPSKQVITNTKTLIFMSVLVNTLLILYILKQNQRIEENAALLSFISKPHLTQKEQYSMTSFKLNRVQIESLLTKHSLCSIHKNTAYKLNFKEDGKLSIFMATVAKEKSQTSFLDLPSYTVPYEVTDSAVSWQVPLPSVDNAWRLIPHISHSAQKIYLRDSTMIAANETCSLLRIF
jgi:hypothetical protein